MRIRKQRLGKPRDLGLKPGTTPGKYRKHAKYVLGEEAGRKAADIYQKKYYEKGATKAAPAKKTSVKKTMTEEEKRAALIRANIRARKKTKKKK